MAAREMHPPSFASLAAAAALAALTLAGCKLGPGYRSPALDIPLAYRATAASAATAWPAPDWWRGFGSPELDGLIEDARRHNFDLQAAIARVREADAQVRISGSPLLPTVGGGASDTWTRTGTGRGSSGLGNSFSFRSGKRYYETRDYAASLSVSYEVDLWGRLRSAQDSAEASALFSRFDQQTVALTAVASVATTYFTALEYQDELAVARRNLRDATDILAALRARLAAGTNSQLDVSQQEALVAGIRASIPGLQSLFEQERNALGILIGRPPEEIAIAADTLTRLPLPEVAAGLPSELLARRPDVAGTEAELIAANADIRTARADMFPQLTLTGQNGVSSTALNTLFNPGTMLTQLVGNLSQTIFDNGLKGGTLELRRARYDELLANYHRAVVQAFTDVENGLVAYRYATEQEALERVAVRTAQRAADIARAQVLAGVSDIVTALQTQTTLFNDLNVLAQDRLNRFNALISLYKALGGGWTRADVIAPPSTIYHGIL